MTEGVVGLFYYSSFRASEPIPELVRVRFFPEALVSFLWK